MHNGAALQKVGLGKVQGEDAEPMIRPVFRVVVPASESLRLLARCHQ